MISKTESDMLGLLRGFYHIARLGSVSGAARELELTQSSVSLQLSRLEKLMGCKLFRRGRAVMELTPEGQLLLEKTVAVFEVMRSLRYARSQSLDEDNTVKVGAIDALAYSFLPEAIQEFRPLRPEAEFSISSHSPSMIRAMLRSGEVELALTRGLDVPETMDFAPLFSTQLMLLVPRSLGVNLSRPCPTPAEIAALPFVGFHPDNEFCRFIIQTLARHGATLNFAHTHEQTRTILQYVLTGAGVTILDNIFVPGDAELDTYSLNAYFPENAFGVLTRRGGSLSPASRAFADFLQARAAGPGKSQSI